MATNRTTGNQRWITFAYRFIEQNGPSTCATILSYLYNQNLNIGGTPQQCSSQLTFSPLFEKVGEVNVKSMTKNKAPHVVYGIVDYQIVAQEKAINILAGRTMISKLRKYPIFLQDEICDIILSHSPNFNFEELTLNRYTKKRILEKQKMVTEN